MTKTSRNKEKPIKKIKSNFWLVPKEYRLKFLLFLAFIFSIVLLLIIYIIQPNLVKVRVGAGELTINKIETNNGNIAIKSSSGNQNAVKNAVLMVSASGSRDQIYSPWVRTGIDVEPNDSIKIEASGSIHTALKKLIVISQTDTYPILDQYQSWYTPDGKHKSDDDYDIKREELRLFPQAPYGTLIAAIWDKDEGSPVKDNTKKFIGSSKKIKIKNKGELVLAVNDILLDPKGRDIKKIKDLYALPINGNLAYYENQLKDLIGDNINSLNKTEKEKAINEIYQQKLNAWDQIERKSRWTVWFDDNVGEFFVSITKSPA